MSFTRSFTQYERATGRIVSLDVMPAEELAINLTPDHGWVDGHYDPETYYIMDPPDPEMGPPLPPVPTLRPANPEPVAGADGVIAWGDVPPETPVWAVNEAGTRLDLTAGEGLQLTDPGLYQLGIAPAFPYHRHIVSVRIE